MAKKKPAKKSSKPAPKPGKKAGKKPAPKKAGGAASGPRPVSTGKGPAPVELGTALVAHFNQGKGDEWIKGVWAPSIVSCEGVGMNMEFAGRKAVEAKNAQWMAEHEVLGASAEGPYVGSTGFAVKFRMHVKVKASGKEIHMEEVGVYTVSNGKIVREEFMYSAAGPG